MINNKKILAIIPARGGSKGLPDKNIKLLLGKPLIGWTIEQAKNSKYIDELHVSTDNKKIAKISEDFGVKIDELRPDFLAKDETSTADVVDYVINKYEKESKYFDYIVLLQTTSPLRERNDIDNALNLITEFPDADGVIGLGEVYHGHPMHVKKIVNNRVVSYLDLSKESDSLRRQDLDLSYYSYGFLYVIKTDIFKIRKTFYSDDLIPYFIKRWQSYDIDDIFDFICVENILKAKLLEL